MPILSCAVCSGEFQAVTDRGKYCSRQCKDKGKPSASGLTCFICSGPMIKGRTSKPQGEAAHNSCRTAESGLHGTSGYRRGCRCPECREGQRVSMAAYVARKKAEDGISPSVRLKRKKNGHAPYPPCFICGEQLKRRPRGELRPMHKECRSTAPDHVRYGAPKWKRDGLASPRVRALQAKIEKAAAGTTGGGRVFTAGNCTWCGEHFVKAGAKWCSTRCKDSARFAARSVTAFKISPKARRAIYERDNWTCQLCQKPVDPTLHYLDSWSASLDHVIPQSHQLIPDHSPKALRLAHRWCNGARGDGTNMDEAELIERAHSLLAA